jgi:hypothetical protein
MKHGSTPPPPTRLSPPPPPPTPPTLPCFQAPQIIRNARTRSAAALSPWFLAEWLLGDTCNLIGCLLTGDQLRTMVFTAM